MGMENKRIFHGDCAPDSQYRKLYQCQKDMIGRCHNPKSAPWHNYGGRGISVCDEWRASYPVFKEWALANGYQSGLELDRANNDGDYCPENCRWVSHKVNSRNTRKVKPYLAFGERKILPEWAEDERCAVDHETLKTRVKRGWDVEPAILTPITPGRHTRNNFITAWGETKTVTEWTQDPRCQVGRKGLTQRLSRGSDPEGAIGSPITPGRRRT